MAKIEMNNEIILLRHTVRQARVCVVNKLIKEIKLLQNKHGNEIQQEKYKRKVDKLLAEIHILKTIKEDDISKFGIMNERDLIKILQDQSSSDSDRIMARIVHYKTIYKKIVQFKEKFPDCKKYLTEKTKKSKKLKNKTKIKNDSKENNIQNKNKNIEKQKIETVQHNSEDEDERNSEVKNISRKRKKSLDTTLEENKLTETKRSCALENEVVEKQPNMIKLCTVTKEATVKKFTEFLEDQDSNEDLQDRQMAIENGDSTGTGTNMQNKTVDNFFITKDNQGNYNDYISLSSNIKHEHNEQVKANNQFTKQNAKYKSNTKLNKNQRYNESRYNQNVRNSRYFDKVDKYQNKRFNEETFTKRETRASNKINMGASKNNLNNSNKSTDENLHPSWLAKKKQQEILSQGFQGKKIVFTDD